MRKQRDRDGKLFAKSMGQYQWQGKEVMRVGWQSCQANPGVMFQIWELSTRSSATPWIQEEKRQRTYGERERERERWSTYLRFYFFHQSCLWPNGTPFIQPLNAREERKAVSWGKWSRESGMLCRRRERANQEGEGERRGGRRGRTWERDHLFLWWKLENWLRRMREGRRKEKHFNN